METYDFFTSYYDEIVRGNGYNLSDEVLLIDEFIQNYSNNKKKILEVACGTGIIGKELQARGYDIFGIDINQKMVDQSIINIGEENAILGDMTKYSHIEKSDIVLCNYNSICHLLDEKLWLDFFKVSWNNLERGGILIFDINTVFEFESITRDFAQFYNIGGDTVCLEMYKKGYIYEWLVKMFVKQKGNDYILKEEVVKEISFEIEKIKYMLEKTGFKVLHLEDFHKIEVDDESERVYFIAQKDEKKVD